MPQKMTERYSRIMGHTASGTWRNTSIQSRHRKAAALRTAVRAAMRTKAAWAPSRSPSRSRWPKRMENTAPLPMHRPSRMEVRKVMRVKEEPTAARAFLPRYRPTIRVSAIL